VIKQLTALPLQNIPIRTDLGREIRRSFASQSRAFVNLDYSALEVRLHAQYKDMITAKDFIQVAKSRMWRAMHRPETFEALAVEERLGRRIAWCAIMGSGTASLAKERATFLIGCIVGYFRFQGVDPNVLAADPEAIEAVTEVIAYTKRAKDVLPEAAQYNHTKARSGSQQGDLWSDIYLAAHSEINRCVH
jgi:DNA polymerase family A